MHKYLLQGNNIHEIEIAMYSEIKRLSVWLNINKRSLNIHKTHTMIFSNAKKSIRERATTIYREA